MRVGSRGLGPGIRLQPLRGSLDWVGRLPPAFRNLGSLQSLWGCTAPTPSSPGSLPAGILTMVVTWDGHPLLQPSVAAASMPTASPRVHKPNKNCSSHPHLPSVFSLPALLPALSTIFHRREMSTERSRKVPKATELGRRRHEAMERLRSPGQDTWRPEPGRHRDRREASGAALAPSAQLTFADGQVSFVPCDHPTRIAQRKRTALQKGRVCPGDVCAQRGKDLPEQNQALRGQRDGQQVGKGLVSSVSPHHWGNNRGGEEWGAQVGLGESGAAVCWVFPKKEPWKIKPRECLDSPVTAPPGPRGRLTHTVPTTCCGPARGPSSRR